MAWKENHVTLSPRHDANMVVAFVSSTPSPLHNSLEVTNWSWETCFFCVSGADEQCKKKQLIKGEGEKGKKKEREQDVRPARDNVAYCLLQCYLISPHKSNIATL